MIDQLLENGLQKEILNSGDNRNVYGETAIASIVKNIQDGN